MTEQPNRVNLNLKSILELAVYDLTDGYVSLECAKNLDGVRRLLNYISDIEAKADYLQSRLERVATAGGCKETELACTVASLKAKVENLEAVVFHTDSVAGSALDELRKADLSKEELMADLALANEIANMHAIGASNAEAKLNKIALVIEKHPRAKSAAEIRKILEQFP
jgi:hypothetical protein